MFVDKMWNHIVAVSNVVDELKDPPGTRDSPAASCRDIKKAYEGTQDGMYSYFHQIFLKHTQIYAST